MPGPGPAVALSLLHEDPGLPGWGLPAGRGLRGDLGFAEPCLYANFVAPINGVTALGPEYPSSGPAISGGEQADRFVTGLLRACAGAVLIGADTLRASPHHLWTPGHIWPETNGFAALRHARDQPGEPELTVATARGDLPARHPALHAGAVIDTTAEGAARLNHAIPATSCVLVIGGGPELRPAELITAIRGRGHTRVLTEGGSRLLGQLVRDGLLDELFLTMSRCGKAARPRRGPAWWPGSNCSRVPPPGPAAQGAPERGVPVPALPPAVSRVPGQGTQARVSQGFRRLTRLA